MRMAFALSFVLNFFNVSLAFATTQVEIFKSISASVEKVYPKEIKSAEFVEDQYILQIEIGKLDGARFDALKKNFNNSSKVKFDPSRVYSLQDFLPPFAQAFNNKLFPPVLYDYRNSSLMNLFEGGEVWPIVKNGVEVSSNCWNASIEYLMSLHGLSDNAYLYVPDMYNVVAFFSENSHVVDESDILPGDVLLVTEAEDALLGTTIQHTAVIIGPNLVFEKVAPDENAPYRISFLSDIKGKFEKLMNHEDWQIPEVKFSYHRVDKSKIKRLGLEFLGMVYGTPISEKLAKELVKSHPEVKPLRLLETCFPGLGGGCDPFVTQVEVFDLITDESGLSSFVLNGNNSDFINLQ